MDFYSAKKLFSIIKFYKKSKIIKKLKNFNVSYFKYKQNKNYLKLLQTKFVIKNYVSHSKKFNKKTNIKLHE